MKKYAITADSTDVYIREEARGGISSEKPGPPLENYEKEFSYAPEEGVLGKPRFEVFDAECSTICYTDDEQNAALVVLALNRLTIDEHCSHQWKAVPYYESVARDLHRSSMPYLWECTSCGALHHAKKEEERPK